MIFEPLHQNSTEVENIIHFLFIYEYFVEKTSHTHVSTHSNCLAIQNNDSALGMRSCEHFNDFFSTKIWHFCLKTLFAQSKSSNRFFKRKQKN